MRRSPQLNGCDYLMLGFDRELRRFGFAGNSCQIILNLGASITPDLIVSSLRPLLERHPILAARTAGMLTPRWKPAREGAAQPAIRLHRHEPELRQRLFNEPLAVRRGELMRFDLIQRDVGRMDLVFTWSHALMDALGAECFLAVLGGVTQPLPPTAASYLPGPHPWLPARFKLAWKYLHHVDELSRVPPHSLPPRFPTAPAKLRYRVEQFSDGETARIHDNGVRHCGPLGDAQYHAAAALLELHELHQRLHHTSPSYVLPVPVSLRRKGSFGPLFGNQVTMLIYQLFAEHLASMTDATSALKAQTVHALRTGLVESGRTLSELFRFLPLPVYMAMLKRGLRGEICSLFFGDTGTVNPLLTSFLGASVLDFTHVAAITPSPGLGVVFFSYRSKLRATVVHSAQLLTDDEAAEFATGLRRRLLES
jgi:hypothetical protein